MIRYVSVGKVQSKGRTTFDIHTQIEKKFGPVPGGLLLGFSERGFEGHDIMAVYDSRDVRARKYVQKLLDAKVKKK